MSAGEVSGREHAYDLVVRGERVLVASGEQPRVTFPFVSTT